MRYIDTVKKAIVFTDIKDFTLKNSLLTQKQIRDYLGMQDEIVFPIIKENRGKLIKTIWDAYMIVFNSTIDAVNTAIEIQRALKKYNENVSYSLYKIELRLTINYWEVQKEETIIWEDYFWDVVNIASRLQYSINENKIFVTSNVIDEIKNLKEIHFVYLWRTSLRWILREIEVFEIIFDEEDFWKRQEGIPKVEKRISSIFLTDSLKEKINEVNNTIVELSLITAIAWMDIIPFISWYIMLLFHYLLLKKISTKFGISSLWKWEFNMIILTICTSLLWTYAIELVISWIEFTKYSWLVWYITFILNFLLSIVIGKALSEYFLRRSQKVSITNASVKDMFRRENKKPKKRK